MASIGVIARLKIKPESTAQFEETFLELAKKVRANEKGCLYYDCFKDMADESVYVIMERYESEEALEAHGKSDYFRAAQPALGAVLAGAPEITRLAFVG